MGHRDAITAFNHVNRWWDGGMWHSCFPPHVSEVLKWMWWWQIFCLLRGAGGNKVTLAQCVEGIVPCDIFNLPILGLKSSKGISMSDKRMTLDLVWPWLDLSQGDSNAKRPEAHRKLRKCRLIMVVKSKWTFYYFYYFCEPPILVFLVIFCMHYILHLVLISILFIKSSILMCCSFHC